MTVSITIVAKVYCSGGYHQPLEYTYGELRGAQQAINAFIRNAGWISKNGEYYCQKHKP